LSFQLAKNAKPLRSFYKAAVFKGTLRAAVGSEYLSEEAVNYQRVKPFCKAIYGSVKKAVFPYGCFFLLIYRLIQAFHHPTRDLFF
jgi:hypothetical protein